MKTKIQKLKKQTKNNKETKRNRLKASKRFEKSTSKKIFFEVLAIFEKWKINFQCSIFNLQ